MGKRGYTLLIHLMVMIMLVSGCSETTANTASYIKITGKGITGKQYWVKSVDPYSHQPQEFKLIVDNENTWNLIEENQEYLATYEYTSLAKGADLLSIKHPAAP